MALEGTLNYLDIAHLVHVVGSSQKSGVLEISWQEREARLFFHRGQLVRAESNQVNEGIGTRLVDAQLLTPDNLERALSTQASEGTRRRLGAILSDDFGVSPAAIQRLLRQQFKATVFDVFSWPGGSFVFHFQEPEAVLDRFHLDPVEFILEVGIEAGLLAEEGVDRAQRDAVRPPVVFLIQDQEISERCREHWRGQGHRVACCRKIEEVFACLYEWGRGGAPLVVVADLVHPAAGDRGLLGGLELLSGVQALRPDVPVVLLGESSDPKARITAWSHGAKEYVKKPCPEDLRGPQREAYLDVFLVTLEKALQGLISAGVDGEEGVAQ